MSAAVPAGGTRRSGARVGEVVLLAWPAVLSFILNNAYRINDQFWIRGLGEKAQAAIGATFFVVIMNFALMFLAVGGTLALVSRATGAKEPQVRDSVARHALLFASLIGAALTLGVRPLTPWIVELLGLSDEVAVFAEEYLRNLYLFALPLALAPAIDNIFIGRGNTRIPMGLQLVAVSLNYFLNPLLIYGTEAGQRVVAPGAEAVGALATSWGVAGMGITGAAVATGLSRAVTVMIGLAILRLHYGMPLTGSRAVKPARIARIARISAPSSLSIAIYAGVYWAMLKLVLSELEDEVTAGLGIGFQVFEGIAFPCYLGVSIAGATLVGRSLGARDPDGAWTVVRSTRFVGRVLGLFFTAAFLAGGRILVPVFAADETVLGATQLYVDVLAFSQYWVAVEAVNERVLVGSGHTRPIMWIGPFGNLLRIPLAWALALAAGLGAAGVWWAINLTTYLKAGLLWRTVQRGEWARQAILDSERSDGRPDA